MPDNKGVSYFIFRKMQAVDERESRLRTALQVMKIQILLRFCNRICYHVYSLSGNGSSSDNQTSHKLCHALVWDSSSERFLQSCKIVNEGMNMSATGRVCFSLAFDDTAHYFGKWLHSVQISNNPIQISDF